MPAERTRADCSTLLARDRAPVYGAFFHQFSFGTFALTQARYAIKVRSDNGCGCGVSFPTYTRD
jgi:hypothetical protein